jgi:hypothetical protein
MRSNRGQTSRSTRLDLLLLAGGDVERDLKKLYPPSLEPGPID